MQEFEVSMAGFFVLVAHGFSAKMEKKKMVWYLVVLACSLCPCDFFWVLNELNVQIQEYITCEWSVKLETKILHVI